MIILIPMAGEGQRFRDSGYRESKPVIPVTDRFSGEKVPMVVAAARDLPGAEVPGHQLIFIDRDFHKTTGVEDRITEFFPSAMFIRVSSLTEGQASTCLLAREFIDNEEELLIGGCDNGCVFDKEKFEREKKKYDALIFSYRNHSSVLRRPEAHGWIRVNSEGRATGMSVKKPISDNPLTDHAVVATFWFRCGKMFLQSATRMIENNDRINNEFYVDQAMQHMIDLGYRVGVFEVEKYLCWGTPQDLEDYERTINYWRQFCQSEDWV